jgi:iron complex outermembrane receptor protein
MISACLPLALLCTHGAAEADRGQLGEVDGRELSTLPLEDLVQLRVVTSASKFAQLISDAPSPVVVLTAADIRDFGWRTLGDALATLPGLYVAQDRNYAYLGGRGFLRPGDYNSRFLLMIDGVRTNDAVYDQALIGTEGLLDMDLVRRIEFVPGPGSAVYGSNALFGVINVITRDGSSLSGVQGALAAGSHGERKARASVGWHGRDGGDLLLAASSYARDGEDLYFAEYDSPDQNNGVARRLDWDRAHNLLLKGSWRGLRLVASRVDRTKGVPTASFGAVFNHPNRTRDNQTLAALSWDGRLSAQVALSAQLSWGRADYLGSGWYQQDSAQQSGLVLNIEGDHARWYGGSVHATIAALPRQKLAIGAEFGRELRRDQFSYDAAPYALLLDDRRSGTRSALFVEDEIHLVPGLLLNAGLRLDRRKSTEPGPDPSPGLSRLTPRLALVYKVTPADTLKLIYGSAFRTPNAYESYYALSGHVGQMANPGLQPERIGTREAVLEHALAAGHATLSLFRYAVSDMVDQQVDPATGLLVFRNVARADVEGAEAALERPFGAARLRARLAGQLGRAGAGAPLVASPRHLAKLNLLTPLTAGGPRLGTEVLCSSARLSAQSSIGGWCVTNLTLGLPRILPDADLSLSMFNAFDKRYADVAGAVFRQQAIGRQGRTLYAKLAYRF